MENKISKSLTFDDVLIEPRYSEILPTDANVTVKLHKNISLNVPIISAAMSTVTEVKMAITIALHGGMGVLHKGMAIEAQAKMVKAVKSFKFEKSKFPLAITNNNKLIVAASSGVTDFDLSRAKALIKNGADAIVVDSAHGHSKNVIDYIKKLRLAFKNICIIAGNISTELAAIDLIKAGADVLKVGMGPGSICTTRVISGVGYPQISAILNVRRGVLKSGNKHVPIIADGGIKFSGDITKAIVAGADAVMLGSLLAGTDEAPGEVITMNNKKYRSYVGMGSLAAISGAADRYNQMNAVKFVPEGIESIVEVKGSISDVMYQLVGGLKAGMGYTGSKNIEELKTATFIEITSNSLIESHPHSVKMTKQAPNYEKN